MASFSHLHVNVIYGCPYSGDAEDGHAKLIMACIYLLMGMAIFSMALNLLADTVKDKCRELAIDLGILDDPSLVDSDAD